MKEGGQLVQPIATVSLNEIARCIISEDKKTEKRDREETTETHVIEVLMVLM